MVRVNAAVELLRHGPATTPRTEPCHRAQFERPAFRLLPWGKFKGESMAEVPISYLAWLIENIDNDEDTRDAARRWLHWRTR
jgi:hypothetical protein